MLTLILRTRMVKYGDSGPLKKGMKGLLELHNVNTNTLEEYGTTILGIAAWMGDEGVVKRLLERFTVNVASKTRDKYSERPLFWAAQEGKAEW